MKVVIIINKCNWIVSRYIGIYRFILVLFFKVLFFDVIYFVLWFFFRIVFRFVFKNRYIK